VGHLHLHVIPRYADDLPDPGDWYPKLQQKVGSGSGRLDSDQRPRLSTQQLLEVANAIAGRATELRAIPSGVQLPARGA
jgi:diadenosine tetraphosphate (Ap4A) HIT family hydrolase